PTEIEIHDDMPDSAAAELLADANIADDWDEAAIRARAAEETAIAAEEAQPGKMSEVAVLRPRANSLADAFPDDEPAFASSANSGGVLVPIASAAVSGQQVVRS